jgi:hypothetical protein
MESKIAQLAILLGDHPEWSGTQSAWTALSGIEDSLDPLLEDRGTFCSRHGLLR